MINENSDRIVMTDDTGIVFSEEEIAKQLKKIKQMIEYKNKSAKEVFEELGYTCKKNDEFYLEYESRFISIMFYLNLKLVKTIDIYDSCCRAAELSFNEIKAISKQMEELGW